MLENVLYTLPESSLLIGIFVLIWSIVFSKMHGRSAFQIAKIFILISALFSVLFYNKEILSQYFVATSYTTLTYVFTCAVSLIWLSVSSKWFLAEKTSLSEYFCILALSCLICLSLIVKSVHFGILFGLLIMLTVFQYLLFRFSRQSEELYHTARRYLLISLVFFALFFASVALLFPNHLDYASAGSFIAEVSPLQRMFILLGILCTLFFFLSLAPFHFWLSEASSTLILPVATYFALIPKMALFGLFFKLQNSVFSLFAEPLRDVYFVFGILSVSFAVIGANASRFLRKIFTSVSLYQAGVILLVLSTFKEGLISIAYIYTEVYLFVLLGVYICFYAFKINGEYPLNLNSLKGVASSRPYIGAAFMLMVATLMSLPPLSYFMMQFVMLSEIAKFELIVYIVLLGLLTLLPVYLKVIETVAFLKREHNFDRVDFGLYMYLLLHIAFLTVLLIKPQILLLQTDILLSIG
ncbi:MAG: hypothetical protein IJ870_06265 [Alphaproteobacteria bacterium]|nr:hypothetical protein [Alphaproteobacteria bacterium]